MPLEVPTTQEEVCYSLDQTALYCQKMNGLICGYDTQTEAYCAKVNGNPAPTACDCVDD